MNTLRKYALKLSANARKKRAKVFQTIFELDESTTVLDLGSENGSNIASVLEATKVSPENVYIADIDANAVAEGARLYGFNKVHIDEHGTLPFEDEFFDVVYCSSVIEHTTIAKADVWKLRNGKEFKRASWEEQKRFATEIERLGKQYFVQTPCRSFPIESHTWLPFVGYLPREAFVPLLRVTNKFWVKESEPDFNLLSIQDLRKLFPGSKVIRETFLGFTKSIMAVKNR